MTRFFGDDRDELDSRGARADDADPFAAEVDLLMRPAGCVKRVAAEAVDIFKWGRILRRQDADCSNKKLRPHPGSILALLDLESPSGCGSRRRPPN